MKIKKRKNKRWIYNLSIIMILSIIIVQIVLLKINISNKKQELLALQNEAISLQEDNSSLQSQLENGISDEYIEKIAREKLNYVSPFERIFIDIAGQ